MSTRIYVPLDSVAIALGADDIAIAIEREANERNLGIVVIRTGSRGMLWLEPLIEVQSESGRLGFGPVMSAEGLLDALISGDTDHPLFLGPVDEIPFLSNQTRLTFKRCGEIDPLSFKEYREANDTNALKQALVIGRQEIIAEIVASGLRGRGGAGFPAGIKWQTVHDANGEEKYIVCNADEGDSGTFSDRMLMEGDPFCLIEGMVIAGIAVGARRGYIYLRSEYPIAAKILNEAIARAYDHGLLGSQPDYQFDLTLFIGAGAYICGEETSLLESLEGKRGVVRSKPPLPAIEGLFGKPTLIHNVISLASVPVILAEGGEHYASYGINRSLGTMPFQLAGNVRYGGLVEVPLGISVRELIDTFGGGTRSGKDVRTVQIGGPLGAYLSEAELDLIMDYERMAEFGYGIGHGGLVVFDESVDLAAQARYAFQFCAEESCGKCTPCRVGSVRGVEVIDRLIASRSRDDLSLIHDLCEVMEDGSLCAMGGMIPVPVKSAIKNFEEDFVNKHLG